MVSRLRRELHPRPPLLCTPPKERRSEYGSKVFRECRGIARELPLSYRLRWRGAGETKAVGRYGRNDAMAGVLNWLTNWLNSATSVSITVERVMRWRPIWLARSSKTAYACWLGATSALATAPE